MSERGVSLACLKNPDPGDTRSTAPWARRLSMMTRRRKKHRPEKIVAKLRDAEAMLNVGKELAAVLQAVEVSESTFDHR